MPAKNLVEPPGRDTRTRILDATEQLMLEEGYAGVSSRKVEAAAGIKSKILHYYFRTMDDLFIAAFERREQWHVARLASAAASSTPLQDLWALGVDAASSRLYLEFDALACHRPAVREVIARSNSRDRITVVSALQSVFSRYGIDAERFPPKVVATTMAGIARVLATDRSLGTEDGHAETLDFMRRLLSSLERARPPREFAIANGRPKAPATGQHTRSAASIQDQSTATEGQGAVDQ